MKLLLAMLALCGCAAAQSVTLTWQDTSNPTGTTYNVYRESTSCTVKPTTFTQITSGLTVLTYQDTQVTLGDEYCYYVTAVNNSAESRGSNWALADLLPTPPIGLKAVPNK